MKKKIIELQFKNSPKKYYFGSVVEIFDRWTKEELGGVIGSVMNVIRIAGWYENKLVYIRRIDVSVGYLLPDKTFINMEDLHFRKVK